MKIYVAVIDRRRIFAFNAADASEARQFTESPAFREDLVALKSKGLALCNGKSEILLREAHSEEAAIWKKCRATAIREGVANGADEEEKLMMFFVPVHDTRHGKDKE